MVSEPRGPTGSGGWVGGIGRPGLRTTGARVPSSGSADRARRPRGSSSRIACALTRSPSIAELKRRGLDVRLLSGDRATTVREVAQALGIERWQAAVTPSGKVQAIEALAGEGRRVLMVGDGLNDAPALAAAYVSLSPATAADVSQTAADAVFQGRELAPVLEILTVARRAERLVLQNFALSAGYNAVTIPLAVMGHVTPLVAAICMSLSSVVVVSNALRLGWQGWARVLGR